MGITAKVILKTDKIRSNGEYPVYLRIVKDRKSHYISVGITCKESLWDKKEGVPVKKHPLYTEYKVKIASKKLEAERFILDLEQKDEEHTALEVIKLLTKKKTSSKLIYEFFDEVIKREKDSGSIKNSLIYKDTKNNLLKFDSSKLHFSDITHGFLNKFQEYLQSTGKGANTIYLYLRTLRALINKAINEGVCNAKLYPFKKFSLVQYNKIVTKKRALTKDELYKIRDFDTTDYPHLVNAKNIFLFSYYCRGINFIDICLLKYSNIENNILKYIREKTNGYFNINLNQPSIDIIEYYRPKTFSTSESYIFPLLYDTHTTKVSIHNRHHKMLTATNKELKELGKLCKIESELTTYVARHTYAMVMKKSGQSITVISESMGHSSEPITRIYLDGFENSYLDEANKAIL